MLAAGAPRPAAIIGMPVGFVGAAESKAALAGDRCGVPYAMVRGRHGRQRDGGGGGERAGEGRAVSGRLIGIGTGPGDPELLTLKAVRALAEADVVAHFAKGGAAATRAATVAASCGRGGRAAAALPGDDRDRDLGAGLWRGDRRILARSAEAVEPPARRPHGGGAERGRSAVLWLLHAPARAAGAALRGGSDPRGHRDVGLLVAGGPAAGAGRRRAERAAGHAGRGGAGAPARRLRGRR